jgi:hypothetical protein
VPGILHEGVRRSDDRRAGAKIPRQVKHGRPVGRPEAVKHGVRIRTAPPIHSLVRITNDEDLSRCGWRDYEFHKPKLLQGYVVNFVDQRVRQPIRQVFTGRLLLLRKFSRPRDQVRKVERIVVTQQPAVRLVNARDGLGIEPIAARCGYPLQSATLSVLDASKQLPDKSIQPVVITRQRHARLGNRAQQLFPPQHLIDDPELPMHPDRRARFLKHISGNRVEGP